MDSPEPINERIARLEERGEAMESRLTKGDDKFANVVTRITELEKQVTYLKGGLAVITVLLPLLFKLFS